VNNVVTVSWPFSVYTSYYYNINVLLHQHVMKLCILSNVGLVCNVQLTEVAIVSPSNKWVSLITACWCVACVVDYL